MEKSERRGIGGETERKIREGRYRRRERVEKSERREIGGEIEWKSQRLIEKTFYWFFLCTIIHH